MNQTAGLLTPPQTTCISESWRAFDSLLLLHTHRPRDAFCTTATSCPSNAVRAARSASTNSRHAWSLCGQASHSEAVLRGVICTQVAEQKLPSTACIVHTETPRAAICNMLQCGKVPLFLTPLLLH